jgi:hypothetical protein
MGMFIIIINGLIAFIYERKCAIFITIINN